MIMHHRLITFVIFIVFLVGCGKATPTSNLISTSHQPSQSSSSVTGFVSSPIITTQSSIMPIPVPTLNQTQVAFNQAIFATEIVLETKVASFPRLCTKNFVRPVIFSPKGLWLEELCYSEDDKDLVLALSNSESQVLWKLNFRDYISPADFAVDGGLSIVYWSNDERHVYFNSYVNTSGGECFGRGNVAESGLGLFRLNLNTGDITTILPPKDNFGWYVYSFSPTGGKLVYGEYAREITILDINSGELTSMVPVADFSEGGGFVWSSDGTELLYSTVLYNETSEPIDYSLRLVDAKSGSEKILLESPKDCFNTLSWAEDNKLKIEKDFRKAILEFDLNTNTIISETSATP